LEVTRAELPGFARVLNKKSTLNWGTPGAPGPTLNLVRSSDSTCVGVGFRFPGNVAEAVLKYLADREGNHFGLEPVTLHVPGGSVTALTALYTGKALFEEATPRTLALHALTATGRDGSATKYIQNCYSMLMGLGIDDPAITNVVSAIQELQRAAYARE
jgi:cation transport regulator ChaC